jgi:hypothetical protein
MLSMDFQKILKYKNSLKIRPMGAELLTADDGRTQTGVTTLTVIFRNFANAPKHQSVNVV